MGRSTRICAMLLLLSAISLLAPVYARTTEYTRDVDAAGSAGQLAPDRTPDLYTGDFADCLGGQSLFNVTKFSAAYYADERTVALHFDGTTNIKNESLMMHISIDAYGTSRIAMTFDPCFFDISNLCPLNASVPIRGQALIPVEPQTTGGVPGFALSIPDFEGTTIVQIFANSSQTQIGCFQAVMTNGASLSHPEALAPVLGAFTAVAIVASFATAAYGVSIPHMRMHYAHSLSVLLIFESFQTIFFTGALSVNWPSLLVAWWSNFAWSAGMIHSPGIASSVGPFVGVSGNASQVGGAGSVVINTGGGLASQIYGRSLAQAAAAQVSERAASDESGTYDYNWAGVPVAPGMPMPGTWTGFPGSLSGVNIPAAAAFLIGLIWLLVAIGVVVLCLVTFKWLLEGLARVKWIREDRLEFFRKHWLRYLVASIMRTLFIAFFMVMTLATYQFNLKASVGTLAIAAVTFALFIIGLSSLVAYACHDRLRFGAFTIQADQIILHRGKLFGSIPCVAPVRASTLKEQESATRPLATLSWFRIRHINGDPSRATVHQDQTYVKRFGWLTARYRRTKWWFFVYYLAYQFVRACFLGGGVQNPLAQVYGLFVFEIIAFLVIVKLNPFEGARNTALAVWMLSITKVVTTGISIAFLPDFDLDRIAAMVLGFIIVVVQALLVLALMVLVLLGAVSSWMTLSRNREDFSPEFLDSTRTRYFENMEEKAPDGPRPQNQKQEKGKEKEMEKGKETEKEMEKEKDLELTVPKESRFSLSSVRRPPKIRDEEADIFTSLGGPHNAPAAVPSPPSIRGATRTGRSNSLGSRYSGGGMPRAGRPLRSSWSASDFGPWDAQQMEPRPASSVLAKRLSGSGSVAAAPRPPSRNSLRVQTLADIKHPSPLGPGRLGTTTTNEALVEHSDEGESTGTP